MENLASISNILFHVHVHVTQNITLNPSNTLFFLLLVLHKTAYYMYTLFHSEMQLLILYPREDAGGLSREYVLRIPSVS